MFTMMAVVLEPRPTRCDKPSEVDVSLAIHVTALTGKIGDAEDAAHSTGGELVEYPVVHDEKNRRFEIHLNGATAYVSYTPFDGGVDYDHTIVPPSLGGRGIGSFLVKYVLDYAKQHDWKIKSSCSFVAVYIDRHPEYQDISLAHRAGGAAPVS